METAVETLEDNKVRIRVVVDAHDVDHAFEHALHDLAKDIRVPGFRMVVTAMLMLCVAVWMIGVAVSGRVRFTMSAGMTDGGREVMS